MKFVFFFTLLINITFYLWEYRKGAPEIYLPAVVEYSTANAEKITLLVQQPRSKRENNKITNALKTINYDVFYIEYLRGAVLDKRPEVYDEVIKSGDSLHKSSTVEVKEQLDTKKTKDVTVSVEAKQINKDNIDKLSVVDTEKVPVKEVIGPINREAEFVALKEEQLPSQEQQIEAETGLKTNATVTKLSACYQLVESTDKKEILSYSSQQSAYTIAFTEQDAPYINNYLVLTLPAESLQQAKSLQEAIKQQGISDLWLFEKGGFKWRISLGLFSSSAEADFAKQEFTKLITQALVVEPDWQKHAVTQVTINAQKKEVISAFEKKFSQYIDKQNDCVFAKQ